MTEREQVLIGLAKTMANCDDAACRRACMNAIVYIQEHTVEWVSVKDRLPNDSERPYLCIVDGNSGCMRFVNVYQEMTFCDHKWLCFEYPDADRHLRQPEPTVQGRGRTAETNAERR